MNQFETMFQTKAGNGRRINTPIKFTCTDSRVTGINMASILTPIYLSRAGGYHPSMSLSDIGKVSFGATSVRKVGDET